MERYEIRLDNSVTPRPHYITNLTGTKVTSDLTRRDALIVANALKELGHEVEDRSK